jgi:adenosylhomocysteinase
MTFKFQESFKQYPDKSAPFLHAQCKEWSASRPLRGISILHCIPVVPNTLLKIACLVSAGADVVITNPDFMFANPEALRDLKKNNIPFEADIPKLKGKKFDLHLDCNAELYRKVGAPGIGSVELTRSGDDYFQQKEIHFPVVSVDATFTKQLETLFGSAESCGSAIAKLSGLDVTKKTWAIFGFGKVGRGCAYYCYSNQIPVIVVDPDAKARSIAELFGIVSVDPNDLKSLENALAQAEIIVTATGKEHFLSAYPKEWFKGKILANMGVLDEFGAVFANEEVLNNKLPVNFTLENPTPIHCIDPAMFAHNVAALELLNTQFANGVHSLSEEMDNFIISAWCRHHEMDTGSVKKWLFAK